MSFFQHPDVGGTMVVFVDIALYKLFAFELVYAEREDVLANAEFFADIAQVLSLCCVLKVAENAGLIEGKAQFLAEARHRNDDEASGNQTGSFGGEGFFET